MYQFSEIFKPEGKKDSFELNKSMERVVSQAKVCLNNKDFEKYRKELEVVKERMLEKMIRNTREFVALETGDISHYAIKQMRMITQYADLRALLDAVVVDSKRAEKVKGDDDE